MEQEVSGEQFRQMSVSSRQPKPKRHIKIPVPWLVIVIVVGSLCFFIGDHYGKDHAPKSLATTNQRDGGNFVGGGFIGSGQQALHAFGTVSSITSTSITIQNPRDNRSSTYSITASTQITDNGQTVAYSDIQTGDTVVITKASASSTDASSILVNPGNGGPVIISPGSSN